MIDYDDVINKHRERLLKSQDQGASKEGEGESQQTENTGEEGAEKPEENTIRLPQIHKTTKVFKPPTSMSPTQKRLFHTVRLLTINNTV